MGTQKNRLNENTKHMFKLMAREINAILGAKKLLSGPMRGDSLSLLFYKKVSEYDQEMPQSPLQTSPQLHDDEAQNAKSQMTS